MLTISVRRARKEGEPGGDLEAVARWRLLGWAVLLAAVTGLALVWGSPPLRDIVEPMSWLERLPDLRGSWFAPVVVAGGFLVGGLLVLPVTPMIVLTVSAFGLPLGTLYALIGVTLSGAMSFGIGRLVGRRYVERLAGSRMHRISQRLGGAGVLAVTTVRMVPIAHFTLVSLTAGASHIRWRAFVAGTALGMTPGIVATALLFDRAAAAMRDPGPGQWTGLLLVSAAVLACLLGLHAWARRRARTP